MSDDSNSQLTPDLAALDARLNELGAAARADAPTALEDRIVHATGALLTGSGKSPAAAPVGVIARLGLNGRRLDWPMRVAAVISVMIGGWAVFHGINGVQREPVKPVPVDGSAEAERLLAVWSALENTGAAEKLRGLWRD
ncbi:MAG: hypothetical protein K2Q09_04885, partial [Phycisphaerales bacterium]|nr:hypothetical protein [Phycisphaerales bacterium]